MGSLLRAQPMPISLGDKLPDREQGLPSGSTCGLQLGMVALTQRLFIVAELRVNVPMAGLTKWCPVPPHCQSPPLPTTPHQACSTHYLPVPVGDGFVPLLQGAQEA